MARVAVAMSGGVDSSTAAALLREDGHEVIGLTLQLWDYTAENLASGRGRCCSPADIADARIVSDRLDMPHYVFDHSATFEDHIVEPFVQGYLAGTTPSPCIRCNRLVKFDMLWKLARALDAEFLATGHYARLENGAARPQLSKGHDHSKDQSYFLFDVPVERFENVIFPLGALAKDEVRAAARRLDVPVADKPESYELCFIPDGDKDGFVEGRLPTDRRHGGPVRHLDGTLLGHHGGLHRFTVGQRRGLGLTSAEPLFVVALEPETGTLIVGPAEALAAEMLEARACNWVSIEAPTAPLRAAARIRHRHHEVGALITPLGDDRVLVEFDEPQRAVAPGQGVAFYDGELLLGGGWIEGT
ncbi:MAG: tRNA 2-thiouridine(34) synthase MnmA [Acidobacteria bacterium]|nr:tRNA 2-thiouridine(34) synthase MnmA [Acidobacteriota bacterium]